MPLPLKDKTTEKLLYSFIITFFAPSASNAHGVFSSLFKKSKKKRSNARLRLKIRKLSVKT